MKKSPRLFNTLTSIAVLFATNACGRNVHIQNLDVSENSFAPSIASEAETTSTKKMTANEDGLTENGKSLLQKLSEFRNLKNPKVKIPPQAALKFLQFLEANDGNTFEAKTYSTKIGVRLSNLKYGVIIDFSAPSTQRRLFFVNLKTGEVSAYYVAHGKGSVASAKDRSKWSSAQYFSNTDNSQASSLGFFVTGESYQGKHGLSLRLHGIEASNSMAFDRAIVMHGAEYVGEDVLAANNYKFMGLSWGCPAMGQGAANRIIPLLANGALVYAYHSSATSIAETKPYLLEPPKILAAILKRSPNLIAKVEPPKPEDDTQINQMPGEDNSPGAQAGNSSVPESEKD